MSEQRLQKLLARAGLASRRAAEEYLRQGRVTVNGAVATLGDKADPERDAIKVDGRRLKLPASHRYLLVNKPRGCLVTRSDPKGRPTVYDLLPKGRLKGLFAVGRLDYHSEGLLLLTDDGEFAQQVAHPRHGCLKTYEVRVKGTPEPEAIKRLRRGVPVAGKRTAPARIRRLRQPASEVNSLWELQLGEGRSRQIREMFFGIGHPVKRLKRVAIGALDDRRLPPGRMRELTPAEVEMLAAGAGGGGRRPAGRRRPRRRRS